MLISGQPDSRRGVHFIEDDDISRAVQRLDKLSAYDKELEKWSKSRQTTERNSLSANAKERNSQIKTLQEQDRSKSVPSEKEVGIFKNLGVQNPRFQKKTYGEELRRQMEEQRQAKANAKKEYIGLPTTHSNAKGPIAYDHSPLLDAEVMMRLTSNENGTRERSSGEVSRQAVAPIRVVETPKIPQTNTQPLPQVHPQPNPNVPPGYPGFYPNMIFPPPGMYPPYPYYFPHPQYQPDFSKEYDPYSYYGLDKRKASISQEKARSPPIRHHTRPAKEVNEKVEDPSIIRIGDIGGSNDVIKTRQTKVPDSLEYARQLKRQMEERERQRLQRKQDDDDYNRKIEAEAQSYNPWGRGGAGAPLKDASGNSLPTRRGNPLDIDREPAADKPALVAPTFSAPKWPEKSTSAIPAIKTGSQHFGRVNEITGQTKANDPQVLAAKNDYQAFLRQQIEEKNAKKEKERELQRLEDEREAARIERDRVRMKEEFEKELEEKKQKEEAQRKANEELKRVAEERRKEQERRADDMQKQAEEERKRQQRLEQEQKDRIEKREPSPPIPSHTHAKSPPIPALTKTPIRSEMKVVPVSESPVPVAITPELSKTQVMNQLSALREQLNRLQNVKREQNETGRVVKIDEEIGPIVKTPSVNAFETALQKAARYRPSPQVSQNHIIFDNTNGKQSVMQGENLDNLCSSEFIPCATELSSKTDLVPRLNNRYNRPPSVTSTTSFDIHEIAQRNEQRLRRLEQMHSNDNVLVDRSPSGILDDFLNADSGSLHCETSFKPVV